MLVRSAEAGDAEAIAAVQVATWRRAYRGLIPQAYLDGLDEAAKAEWWRSVLATGAPGSGALVALDGDRVLGFVSFGPPLDPDAVDPGVGQVYAIYVDPQVWRRGAGAALMDGARSALRAAGFGQAVLWVIDGNERAQRFYERVGWSLDGAHTVDEYGGAQIPEVRYRTELEPSTRMPIA